MPITLSNASDPLPIRTVDFANQVVGHLTPQYVGELVGRALPEGPSMHALRHRFASRAYRGSRNLRAVQVLLGHASIATTERYTAMDDDEIRAAMVAPVADWSAAADELIGAGVTRIDRGKVAAVLAELADGTAPSTMARRVGVGYATVARIAERRNGTAPLPEWRDDLTRIPCTTT